MIRGQRIFFFTIKNYSKNKNKKITKKSKQIDTAKQYTEQECTTKFFQINNGLYIIYV